MKRKLLPQVDMTSGRILPNVIAFAIPLIITSYLQLLYNAADLVVVGKWAGDACLAAVGVTGSTINLLLNVFLGLSVGAGVVFANYYGAQDKDGCHRTLHTAVLVALISGIFIGGIAIILAPEMLRAQDVPEEVLPLAVVYIRIYFAGAPVNILYNFGASIMRASGDTKRPLYFLTLAGMINVIFNLIFVICFKMTVDGVAIATIISQAISAALVIISLMKNEGMCRLSMRELKIHKAELSKIIKIGVPAGLNGVIFSISNLIIQTAVNSFGKVAMSGVTVASNIEGFTYQTMNGFSQAAIAFSGQNYGAKKPERMKKILVHCLALAAVSGLALSIVSYILGRPLLKIYTDTPEAIDYGMLRLKLFAFTYFMHGMAEVLLGMVRGWGRSLTPTIVSLTTICVFRIAWIYTVFAQFHDDIMWLYLAYPISWALELAGFFIYYLIVQRKMKRELMPNI